MNPSVKIYYPHLNGLRFVAFLLVFVHHAEQFKSLFNIPSRWQIPFVAGAGSVGVHLFFVLSGFLITSILLEEESRTGAISVRRFYIRRMLRIWPLYFLVLAIGFSVLPSAFSLFPFFAFFVSNAALILHPPVPGLAPTWSISTEEQFYIIWPHLMRFFKSRDRLFISVIIFHFFLSLVLALAKLDGINRPALEFLSGFLVSFAVDYLAMGAWFAWVLRYKSPDLSWMRSVPAQLAAVLLPVFSLLSGFQVPFVHRIVEAYCFGVLIFNFASNPNSLLNLENPALNYLGKISYGLYLFHSLCLMAVLRWSANLLPSLPIDATVYAGGLILTTLAAAASYHFFEMPFLRKKSSFSSDESGLSGPREPRRV